jgi:uncharacterized protein (DUF1800 family)
MSIGRPAAAHLLRRAAYGGTVNQIRDFSRLTREEAVDQLLDTSSTPSVPGWGHFAHLENWQAQEAMIEWWVDRMITAPPSIEEKLTFFWHDHFATGRDKVGESELMWEQHRLLRTMGQGSFRALLEGVSLGSAMLIYLDNETNVAGAEQENFARELMELHTVGNGRFTEDDVVAMARAWTGHNTVGRTRENNWQYDPSYIFRTLEHDHGPKTLFGITKRWNALQTLDELCYGVKATATSDYIARKMFQFFVHANPAQSTVDSLAANWRANNLNILSLVREVLLLDEFWAESTHYALVKTPVELMVDVMRRCNIRSHDTGVRWRMEQMGMVLFDPPNVAGWGRNGYWLSTATAWGKSRWINNLKWGSDDRNVLQGLGDMPIEDAVDEVIGFFGIYGASTKSRDQVRELIEITAEERPWALKYEPFAIGMFMPEVQCA